MERLSDVCKLRCLGETDSPIRRDVWMQEEWGGGGDKRRLARRTVLRGTFVISFCLPKALWKRFYKYTKELRVWRKSITLNVRGWKMFAEWVYICSLQQQRSASLILWWWMGMRSTWRFWLLLEATSHAGNWNPSLSLQVQYQSFDWNEFELVPARLIL